MATKRSPDRAGAAPAGACAMSPGHALATRRWWALGALSLGLYMTLVSVHMVAIARPTIQLELDLTLSQLQWVGSAYTMSIAILMLAGGRFADTLGSKRVYMAGLAIFIAGSILSSGARGEGLFAGEGCWPADWFREPAARYCFPPGCRSSRRHFPSRDGTGERLSARTAPSPALAPRVLRFSAACSFNLAAGNRYSWSQSRSVLPRLRSHRGPLTSRQRRQCRENSTKPASSPRRSVYRC